MLIIHVRKNEFSRVTRNSYTGDGHGPLALKAAKAHRVAGYQVACTVERLDTPADDWATPNAQDWN